MLSVFEEYFEFIGSSKFDVFVMSSLSKDLNIEFIINKKKKTDMIKNKYGKLNEVTSWYFDIKNCRLQEEKEFKKTVKRTFKLKKCLVANITLKTYLGNHRNILIIDIHNNIIYFFEPNLLNNEEDPKKSIEYENMVQYFLKIVKTESDKFLVCSKFYNYGMWMDYQIYNVIKNKKLIEVAKTGPYFYIVIYF